MEQFFKVGVITSTHGLKGEVKVFPTTDDPERFYDLEKVILRHKREEKILEVEHVRFFKNMVIVKFKGINDINQIETYRQAELYVSREDAITLEEDEYYIADLIGLQVYTEDGVLFGTLKDVMQTGANDVYIIEREDGTEVLVPAIGECILHVDPEGGRMDIHLLPGLI